MALYPQGDLECRLGWIWFLKVCSLNCIYCEVGRTTELTIERREFILYDKIIGELEHYFSHNPKPEYITFSGSGEPTLNARMGDVLQFIKRRFPDIPVAVLTNGTLLYNKKVRDELLDADVVLPSLDAATELAFKRINRPFSKLTVKKYIQGLIDFRNEYSGQIWLEVFIVPGYNDSRDELNALKEAIRKIRPNQIQLNTLDRPGTIDKINSAGYEELKSIIDFWDFDNIEIIADAPQRKSIKSYRKDAETAILETIRRRPCTVDDLVKILGLHINEINKYLDVLNAEDKIDTERLGRGVFYKIK